MAHNITLLQHQLQHTSVLLQTNFNPTLLSQEQTIQQRLANSIAQEALYWKNKFKLQWSLQGDLNTKFFHAHVSHRRRINHIEALFDSETGWHKTQYSINNQFRIFYENLFHTTNPMPPTAVYPFPRLSALDKIHLIAPITEDEIYRTIQKMGRNKSPGPDGLTVEFYLNQWSLIRSTVTSTIFDFFSTGNMSSQLNHTYLIFIPKRLHPTQVTHYRPIRLCNVIYKIISSIMVARL